MIMTAGPNFKCSEITYHVYDAGQETLVGPNFSTLEEALQELHSLTHEKDCFIVDSEGYEYGTL